MTISPYLNETITQIDADGIRVIRARLGLTQEQLATHVGVSIDTIKSWESGRRTPAPDARAKLVYLSRPNVYRAATSYEKLRDTAQQYDADAIAYELAGDTERSEMAVKVARSLHKMADSVERDMVGPRA